MPNGEIVGDLNWNESLPKINRAQFAVEDLNGKSSLESLLTLLRATYI